VLRTRIAPSPTGPLHAGNVFAALMAWLIARREGGVVLLRIEDLDPGRSRTVFIDQALRDFEWLGIDWDEETVYQSERNAYYAEALATLETKGLLYPCFCSRADLHAASAPHADGSELVYCGTCRHLDAAQRAERACVHTPALRLIVPDAQQPAGLIAFDDLLQGSYVHDLGVDCGDFIVRRSDGVFAYQLAVVVDDLLQGVDCIVRGRDLIDSTPRQIYLRRLLRNTLAPDAPTDVTFYHLPLLVDSEGRRLSKRSGSDDMACLRRQYPTPEKLLGHLAHRAGIVDGPESPLPLDELRACFSVEALKRREAISWT
jgi:glutamyl-tRNA synthetase